MSFVILRAVCLHKDNWDPLAPGGKTKLRDKEVSSKFELTLNGRILSQTAWEKRVGSMQGEAERSPESEANRQGKLSHQSFYYRLERTGVTITSVCLANSLQCCVDQKGRNWHFR